MDDSGSSTARPFELAVPKETLHAPEGVECFDARPFEPDEREIGMEYLRVPGL
jgi:hypothetical protein